MTPFFLGNFFWGCAMQLAGPSFPDQGLNPGLGSESRVLTTGAPRNALFFKTKSMGTC